MWIDCEMTGLDLGTDRLIEVAALVTDAELNILGDGVDLVIHADEEALARCEVVPDMHRARGSPTRRGLHGRPGEAEAGARLRPQHVRQPRTAPLAVTRSPPTGLLARDMPALDSYLHYRMIDVCSIKELCRRWYPRIYFGQPEKGLAHRALADIQESIRELRYYRRTAFVLPPGPSTSEIEPVVADLHDGNSTTRTNDSATEPPSRLVSTSPLVGSTFRGRLAALVGVVQLVERQVVILNVAGSSPVTHPNRLGSHCCFSDRLGRTGSIANARWHS